MDNERPENISVSFEFFPPKTQSGHDRLLVAADSLEDHEPDFMSVTYGAAGSDRNRTEEVVVQLSSRLETPIVPHLTCVAHTKDEIEEALLRYKGFEITQVLALAGDTPNDGRVYESDYTHAEELVIAAKSLGDFRVGVAAHPEGHPQSPDLTSDRKYLARKLRLADFAITQFFFESEVYERMIDDLAKRQVDTPVIPGIMPISSVDGLYRMATMNNTSIPNTLRERLENARGSNDEIEKIGVETASELADRLISSGAPGIHLYTMNRAILSKQVLSNLRI